MWKNVDAVKTIYMIMLRNKDNIIKCKCGNVLNNEIDINIHVTTEFDQIIYNFWLAYKDSGMHSYWQKNLDDMNVSLSN